MLKHSRILVSTVVALACGCAVEAGEQPSEPLDSIEEAFLSGYWIGPISEEPEIHEGRCVNGFEGVSAAHCSGGYCDNNSLLCSPLPNRDVFSDFILPFGAPFYTSTISEELPWNTASCRTDINRPAGMQGFVIGMWSSGANSDNLSLICQPARARYRNCRWTPYFSEEQGSQDFQAYLANSYATGVRCKGKRCDQVSYEICEL